MTVFVEKKGMRPLITNCTPPLFNVDLHLNTRQCPIILFVFILVKNAYVIQLWLYLAQETCQHPTPCR